MGSRSRTGHVSRQEDMRKLLAYKIQRLARQVNKLSRRVNRLKGELRRKQKLYARMTEGV